MAMKNDGMQQISTIVPPIPRSPMEEEGYSLLLVDLLRLSQRFSFARYRIDLIGFVLAWIWVVLILALGYWITRIGS
jgi:hypothetical protein